MSESEILAAASADIKRLTGLDIKIELKDVPADWHHWVTHTGVNSVANDDSWAFLSASEWNQPKINLWKERNIHTIQLAVDTNPDAEDHWIVCEPEWESGSKTLKLWFNPCAGRWESEAHWATKSGYHRWWNLADEIQYGLQLYQLPGKCFYKSDWLENFDDVNPDAMIPNAKHKVKRWFQFRHWIIYWYPSAQWGYNWAYTTEPPKLPDGSLFDINFVLKCPSLPNLEMPSIKLPSLPNVSLPSLPSVSMPSISAPSLSMPSLKAPSMPSSLPSMPDRKNRPKGKWAAHGFIELPDMRVKVSGKDLILSNATVTDFWEKDGWITTERAEHQRFVLLATSAEQAESWKASLMESGVEEGDIGGCCTVA